VNLQKILQYARDIPPLVEGIPPWRVDPAIDDLFEHEEWELISVLLLTVADPTARQMVDRLLKIKVYDPLVLTACLRRHVRSQPYVVQTGRGVSARIFRDIDAEEEDARGVPEHILEDIQDMAEASERTREAQILRSESLDRGPMREFIINRLAERLATEPPALEALLVVAKAAAWEETRRIAAMKIANHQLSVQRLAQAGRTADLIALAAASQLSAVANNFAAVLSENLDELKQRGDREALAFIAENHENQAVREAARAALGSDE